MSTRRRRGRKPPASSSAREALSFDLLLEIVLRSDVTTVVRCAATGRILRRAILDPAFGRRLALQAAAADGGRFKFDPALLLAVSYHEFDYQSNTASYRIIHAPDPATRRLACLDATTIHPPWLRPLVARDGLFLHRCVYRSLGRITLHVVNTLTGHVTHPPQATLPEAYRRALLSSADGGSFDLLLADNSMRFQIFSSKDGKWGVVRKASFVPPHHPQTNGVIFLDPAVVGRTIYWIYRRSGSRMNPEWRILALDVDAAQATKMDLPAGCVSSMMPYMDDKGDERLVDQHLLLASVRGRLSLFVMESIGISMWTLSPATSGSAETWNRQLVIGAAEMLRQTGFVVYDNLARTPFNLEGFGERSGSMILSLGCGQLFRLDHGITEEATVVTRLISPGSVQVSGVFLHETDRITLLKAMKFI
ncbi:unnamed protein product [Triticum turgidum subsp. durum]|uniref:DUF7595 domain-containing protein n=1 Tax=Triticum turgidum subsp. durum TaxID=4567 RepID=A0A9R0XIF3_TRITD|nr:unnamed protein product [Triticum turgidum subsp. durum]